MGCGLVHTPQFSQLFTVYYHDMGGKEMERCMVISPMTIYLPLSSQYDYQFDR